MDATEIMKVSYRILMVNIITFFHAVLFYSSPAAFTNRKLIIISNKCHCYLIFLMQLKRTEFKSH